jgi:LysM repeat protein
MPLRVPPLIPAPGRLRPRGDLQWKELTPFRGRPVSASPSAGKKFLYPRAVAKTEGETFHTLLQKRLCAGGAVEKVPRFRTTMPHYPLRTHRGPTETPAASAPLQAQPNGGPVVDYVVKPGDTLWELAVGKFHVKVEDLMRDNLISDPRELEPGHILKVRIPSYPGREEVVASWYGHAFHGRPMANGAPYDMYAATIAHRELPLGTRVELENPETGRKVVAVVTDRGPFVEGRDVDLSYGLARSLSLVEKGVDRLIMRVLG